MSWPDPITAATTTNPDAPKAASLFPRAASMAAPLVPPVRLHPPITARAAPAIIPCATSTPQVATGVANPSRDAGTRAASALHAARGPAAIKRPPAIAAPRGVRATALPLAAAATPLALAPHSPPRCTPSPRLAVSTSHGGHGAHRHRAGRHLRHGAFPHRSFRIGRRQRRQQARRCRQRQRRGQQRFLLRAERRHPGKPRPPRRAGAGPAARLHADPRRPHQPRRSEGPLRLRPRQRDQRRRRTARRARALRPFPRELEQRALLLRQQWL